LEEIEMAVAYLYPSTSVGGSKLYDDIKRDLGEDPPDGLILHVAGLTSAGEMQIFEVWESEDARTRFSEKLFPAFARHGFDPFKGPEPIRLDVHNMMGRAAVKDRP
jgi:hypothetical protein